MFAKAQKVLPPVLPQPGNRHLQRRSSPVPPIPAFLAMRKPTLLCCQGRPRDLQQTAVEVAGERTLDAAPCFSGGLARSEEPLVVGGGLWVVADPWQGDDVERPVELAVAAAVQAVPWC
jgi:hypothetical protein